VRLHDMMRLALLAGCGAILCVACDTSVPPETVLARQCASVSGARPFEVQLVTARKGLLVVDVEQRGISTTVTMEDGGASLAAQSPIERYGLVTLARETGADEPVQLRVASRDSPEIVGEICVAARVGHSGRKGRAELAYARAGMATHARDWDTAFTRYTSAAADFDRFDPRRAASARQAMGELAYRMFNLNRDAQLLADQALRGLPPGADAGLRSSLLSLKAKALLGMEGLDPQVRRERVFALLDASEKEAHRARFGSRELPRLNILRGFMEYVADRPDASTAHFGQASAQCEAAKDWECYARARQNLGAMAEETHNYAFALQAFEDALKRLDVDTAPELAADIWGNLGRLQSTAGIIAPSAQSLGNAMRIYAHIDSCDGARRSLVRLGRLLAQVGSIEDALGYLHRGASLACPQLLQRIGQDASAMVAESAEPPLAADAVCAAPLDRGSLSEDGKFAVFLALLSLNDTLLLERETEAANFCLERAKHYATSSRDRLRLANAQGATELRRGEVKAAGASFTHALQIADKAGLSATQLFASRAQLGVAEAALLSGDAAGSIRAARQALQTSAARGEVSQMVAALQLLAGALRASKDHANATRTLEVAVQLIEQVPIDELDGEKRATYLASQHAVYAELTELLITGATDEARSWAAFLASERGRARSLRFATSQAEHASLERAAVETSDRYAQLVRSVAEPAIAEGASLALPEYLERIGALIETDGALQSSIDPAQLLQQLARLDASLVQYSVGRDRMFAFVISNGRLHVVDLGDNRRITAAAEVLYARIRDPEMAPLEVRRAAAALAEAALWPLREHLSQSRLVIVPDDSLHAVPFAALPWSEDAKPQLLVERLEAVVAPSASFLGRPPGRTQPAARSLVLFGDPIFRERDWNRECAGKQGPGTPTALASTRSMSGWAKSLPRLPATRDEVLSIAQLAQRASPAGRIETRVGCAATRSELRKAVSQSPEILHVATHGYVDAHRPRLSALALSPEAGKTGDPAIYTLMDILDTKLDSRLVVLSACETSRGRLLPGEGVLGPAQAFLQSGAASVLASHWRVADVETAAFMRSFYRNLLEQRLPAAAALRRAQLELLAAGPDLHWAAFSLYGWPDISFGAERNR
jgi:CHAT domain-containing protein